MLRLASIVAVAVTIAAPWLAQAESSLQELNRAARERIGTTARVPLAASLPSDVVTLEPVGSDREPNYLRAFATAPSAAAPFAQLLQSVLQAGAVEPEAKMAMGLRSPRPMGALM